MNTDSSDIGAKFRSLHETDSVLVVPNPWDVGSARILAASGFKALATTSAGMAFGMGVRESTVSKELTLAHCQAIVNATPLPVSADLEKGFGDTPESVAECIRAAAAIGLAGCSIEDHTGDANHPIYERSLAVERISAAVEAVQQLEHDFVLTARCESLLWGKPNIDDVIHRLSAFSNVGADVLYAPGLYDLDTIKTVCSSVDKPVNVVMGMPGITFSVEQLAQAGVKRISVGSAMARVAYGSLINAANDIVDKGHFNFTSNAIGFSELESYF